MKFITLALILAGCSSQSRLPSSKHETVDVDLVCPRVEEAHVIEFVHEGSRVFLRERKSNGKTGKTVEVRPVRKSEDSDVAQYASEDYRVNGTGMSEGAGAINFVRENGNGTFNAYIWMKGVTYGLNGSECEPLTTR